MIAYQWEVIPFTVPVGVPGQTRYSGITEFEYRAIIHVDTIMETDRDSVMGLVYPVSMVVYSAIQELSYLWMPVSFGKRRTCMRTIKGDWLWQVEPAIAVAG